MKMLRKILCTIGIHSTTPLMIVMHDHRNKPVNIWYSVCVHCGDGDPRITGEY